MHSLKDKVVLITGASSGIGRATALRLAGAGARLALVARTEADLEAVAVEARSLGVPALVLPTDVADADQCRRAVEATVTTLGGVDVLLNCAGVSMQAPFADCDLAAMEKVIRVNFFGTLYMTHHALPHVSQRQGSLVAISSLTGHRGIPGYAAYGASKFAVHGLYESLRVELADQGVHVGVLAPGFVATPLRDHVLGADGTIRKTPATTPFRVWPLERCVDLVVRMLVRRQREALLPAFVRPLLAFDVLTNGRVGDGWLRGRFRRGTR
jgi:NAD(P)-dependent dehydrogenase (short-subunit alcohol dehydrogenase family)